MKLKDVKGYIIVGLILSVSAIVFFSSAPFKLIKLSKDMIKNERV